MQNENPTLDELEEEIALYRRRLKSVKAGPAYRESAEVRKLAANLERIVSELEDAVAAKHAAQLMQEAEEDRLLKERNIAFANLHQAIINKVLEAKEDQPSIIAAAALIRDSERLHNLYQPQQWAAIAHLLPAIE